MMGPGGGNGRRRVFWQFGQARGGYKITWLAAHNRVIFRRGLRQIALSPRKRRARTCQTRLRQCHIGSRDLAHFEPILSGAQFLFNQFHIGRSQ